MLSRGRLARIDAYAEAHGISRSELLLSGAERIIAAKRPTRATGGELLLSRHRTNRLRYGDTKAIAC